MRLTLLLSLLLITLPVHSQQIKHPFPLTVEDLNDFELPGWFEVDAAEGDLNADGRSDYAIIYQQGPPLPADTVRHRNAAGQVDRIEIVRQMRYSPDAPRALGFYLAQPDTTYRLAAASVDILLSSAQAAETEPITLLQVKKGILILRQKAIETNHHQYYAELEKTHRLRLKGTSLQLIGYTYQITETMSSYQETETTSQSPETHVRTADVNLLTGKAIVNRKPMTSRIKGAIPLSAVSWSSDYSPVSIR